MKRSSLLRSAVLFMAVALFVAACTSSNSSDDSSGGDDANAVDAEAILGTKNEATGTPVKIGLINTEGGAALSLPNARKAAEAAADYANEYLGGLDGQPIEVITCNEQGDAASAGSCATELVQEGVAAVVVTASGQGDAMVPTIVDAEIPFATTSGGSISELTTPGVYLWTGGVITILGAWAQYAADNDIADLTIFTIDVPTATGAVDAIGRPAFEKVGVGVDLVAIPPGTADATPQVTAALGDSPGAFGILGDAAFCQSVLSALDTAAATEPIFVISTCDDTSVREALPDALDGTILFSTNILGEDEESELYFAVMQTYSPDTDPSGFTAVGYQSFLGFVRAVNDGGLGGEASPTSISNAIASATAVPIPLETGQTFTCDGSAVPSFSNVCSATVLVAEILGEDTYGEVTVIDPASLFAL